MSFLRVFKSKKKKYKQDVEKEKEAVEKEREEIEREKRRVEREKREFEEEKKEVEIKKKEVERNGKEEEKQQNNVHDGINVCAIDLGTTFSGYAFSKESDADKITQNKNWGAGMGFQVCIFS